jgi:ankyrin repeat protein
MMAAMGVHVPVIERLIAAGARADQTDREGRTAAQLASLQGKVAAVEVLGGAEPEP